MHQMLEAELSDFLAQGYKAANGICAAVIRGPTSGPSAVPAAVFEALERDVASSVMLIPYSVSECPFDNVMGTIEDRWLLSVSNIRRPSDAQPNWLVGFTNPALYGWGRLYRVEIDGDEVSVEPMGEVIS